MATGDKDVFSVIDELHKLKEELHNLKEELNIHKSKPEEHACQIGQNLKKLDTVSLDGIQTNDEVSGNYPDKNGKTTSGAFCEYVKGLVSQTSLHGLPNIANSTEKWIAVFWMLLLIAGTGMSGWQLVEIFKEYFRYPVLTITEVDSDVSEIPEVTICNKNPFLKSLVEREPMIVDQNRPIKSEMDWIWRAQDLPEDDRIRLSHNITDFIHWNDYPSSVLEYDLLHDYHLGNCYSFEQTVKPNNVPAYIHLDVNLNTKDYIVSSEHHMGNIYLREKNISTLYSDGVDVSFTPGYRIELNTEITSIVRLNGKYANCQDDEEKFFEETGIKYSQMACRAVCVSKRILADCGCTFPAMHFFPRRYKVSKIFANVSTCIDAGVFCEHSFSLDGIDCNCKPRCDKKEYKISRILKTKLAKYSHIYLCRQFSECNTFINDTQKKEWVMNNIAEIRITFSNPINTEFRQVPAYPLSQFLPDIGGTLGLYLGLSLLTVAEIPQLLIGTAVFCVKRKMRRTED